MRDDLLNEVVDYPRTIATTVLIGVDPGESISQVSKDLSETLKTLIPHEIARLGSEVLDRYMPEVALHLNKNPVDLIEFEKEEQ
jgi:hypothetical protein